MLSPEIRELLCNLFLISVAIVVLKICIAFLEYIIWSKKISHKIPGIKVRFFNILGDVSLLPLAEKSRNGFSLLIHAQQVLLGFSKIFVQKNLYHFKLFIFPIVVLAKAEAVQEVFSTAESERPWFFKWSHALFGNGLLVSGGKIWKSRRRLMNVYFRKDILKELMPLINKQARILVENLKKETRENFTKIKKPLSESTLNLTRGIVCGVDEDENLSNLKDFYFATRWGLRFLAERMMNIFLWPDVIYFSTKRGKELKKLMKTVHDFTKSVIEQRKQKYQQGYFSVKEAKEKPLLDLLFYNHFKRSDFAENDISDELITFLIAGQDTTSAALSWILYMLGLHQDIQAQVHEEVDSIFRDEPDREVIFSDLNEMKYLKCVIKETLRLYPSVPALFKTINNDINISGCQIPKGTTCVAFPYVLHRDEEVFPDAERFNPDRFSPENSQDYSSYCYLPFSVGPRNCIGQKLAMMSLMVIVSTVLRSYKLESLDQRDKVLPALTLTITPSKPIRIRIRERNSRNNFKNP